jgi:predicted Holliday junction resolvase-like endonuclease
VFWTLIWSGTILAVVLSLIGLGAALYVVWKDRKKTLKVEVPTPVVKVDMQPIHKVVENIPNKVLQSITSSTNVHKGALGELIGYVQLHAQYDRIIPLGNIVDFVCIKFPSESCTGQIDFVDVKTGSKSRLSKDQKELQSLIEEKKINFVKLKVETTS